MRGKRLVWIVAVVAAVVIVVGIVAIANRDDGGDGAVDATTTSGPPSRLELAADAASVEVEGVERNDVEAMIEELCTTQEGTALAEKVVDAGVSDRADVLRLVEGVGRGAAGYCPEVAAAKPQLVNDAYNATLRMLDANK